MVVGPRHGIGEYVVEQGDCRAREHVDPFAPLGLHGDEAGVAFQLIDERARSGVVPDGIALPTVGRNAVEEAVATPLRERLVEAEALLQMYVIVDDGVVVATE